MNDKRKHAILTGIYVIVLLTLVVALAWAIANCGCRA